MLEPTYKFLMKFSLLLAVALLLPQLVFACPPGAGETKLTLTRVMRHFGKGISPADKAAKKGAEAPLEVSDAELELAMNGLALAMSCAQAVAADRSGDLYPKKASELSGDIRERYLVLFFSRMNEFLQGLADYRAIYAELRALPPGERSFARARTQMRAVAELASRAHEDLQ